MPDQLTRAQSVDVMKRLVYPKAKAIAALHSVEAVAEDERLADFLDKECKIDAFVKLPEKVAAIASRIHPVKPGDDPFNTFTMNLGSGPGLVEPPSTRR